MKKKKKKQNISKEDPNDKYELSILGRAIRERNKINALEGGRAIKLT